MILVGIAGTYTPVIILALDGATRVTMAIVCWVVAGLGIVLRLWWLEAPRPLISAVYLVAGWMILLDLPAYVRALSSAELALLAVGGGLYTLGALVFAVRWPNPWVGVFGYHEVFHTFVIAAALARE